jgi:tetratricopeptide (TPR) repeat protein
MSRAYIIAILIISAVSFGGCGGKKGLKNIDERAAAAPSLSLREAVNDQAFNNYVNGTILEMLGDLPTANHQYAEALKYYPNSAEIRYAYGATFFRMNDFRRALAEANKASPRTLDIWLLTANSYRALGINDSALAAYYQTIKYDSNNVGVYQYLAACYQQADKLDSAIWAYENIARLSPGFRIYQEIANLQMRIGDLTGAQKNYSQSIALDSSENNVRSFLGLSVISEQSGDRAKAKIFLETAARLSPQNALIQNRLLGFYQENNEWDKAMSTAKAVILLAPLDKSAVRRLGIIYYNADSLRLADSIFADLLNGSDADIIDYYYAGRIAYLKKDYSQAKINFLRVTALADSVVDGWLNLGLVYHDEDSLGQEIAIYDTALTHLNNIDDSVKVLFALGAALERHGDFDRAVAAFRKILTLQPNHSPSLNYLGYMLADKGVELDYALEIVKKALELMPENGAYIDSYGWILYRQGHYQDALKELLRALEYIDDDATVMDHIGDTYKALDDSRNARLYWEKALKLDPQNKKIREKLDR